MAHRKLPKEFRLSILERDEFKCVRCGCGGRDSKWILEIDHILPVSQGGSDDPENLRTLCVFCHDVRHHGFYTGRNRVFPSRMREKD